MKTRLLIIIGIIMLTTIPFVTFAVLDRYSDYVEHMNNIAEEEANAPKLGDKYYIKPQRKAELVTVELDLREKIMQLHQKNSLVSFAVNLDHQTQEIIVTVEKTHFNTEIEEIIAQYPDDISIVFTNEKIQITYFSEPEQTLDTFMGKSLNYWKSLNEDQLREYNSKFDRGEFYYALGELLAKEYFLEKLVELNLVNVNDDLTIHTGFALESDPPRIGFITVVNATDGFSYVMHTSVNGNRLGEYFNMAKLVFEPHILKAIAENKPVPFINKFGESPTIYIVTEEGDDKLSSNAVIIDFDQTNTITFVNNSPNPVRIQEVGENKIDEIPKDSWRTKAIIPGESLTMQFNSTGFYEFNVKKITDYFPDYLEHHATGEIVIFTENMTDYTFAEGLLMGSTFIQDAPRPEIPWQSIGAGNNRELEIGIVDSVIEAFPNAYEYYLTKAKSLIPFDVPITIEFSGPIRLD